MSLLQVAVLALIQGLAELLPVSSSAHVIVAERLMGLDPSSPEMTLLLLMLHTGTMLSVLAYFGKDWKGRYFSTREGAVDFAKRVLLATFATVLVGFGLKHLIEKVWMGGGEKAEVEALFGDLGLISAALACAGLLILAASFWEGKGKRSKPVGALPAAVVGIVQGLCLPFRGFSRSGATISAGLLLGWPRVLAEDFSFAMVLVITPPLLAKEVLRLLKAQTLPAHDLPGLAGLFLPGLAGMVLSFAAGLLALRWLSSWLSAGRWGWFGVYCLLFALFIRLALL